MKVKLPDDIQIFIACGKTDMRKSKGIGARETSEKLKPTYKLQG